MNLGEKNYQNLVEVLTDGAINNATHASLNSLFFLPQSSDTFPGLSNQSDTYKVKRSEIFHNSKGDITE